MGCVVCAIMSSLSPRPAENRAAATRGAARQTMVWHRAPWGAAGPMTLLRPSEMAPCGDRRISVVIATWNRCAELVRTLRQLTALPERPRLVVVDNASTDGPAAAVREGFPGAELVVLRPTRG